MVTPRVLITASVAVVVLIAALAGIVGLGHAATHSGPDTTTGRTGERSPSLATDTTPSSTGLAAPPLPAPTSTPAAPGQVVASGENQSDPFLLRAQGRYFLYTSGIPSERPVNVPVASASDFSTWSPVTDALPQLPRWAVPGFTWAPDVHRFGDHYVLYFTAAVTGTGQQCVGIATATSPTGPFTAGQKPFICESTMGGTIDPRVFTDSTGAAWMQFKSDQNIGGAATPTVMWSQRLSADGLHLLGRPSRLMAPDEPWQGTVVEAPNMVAAGGNLWLVYSGNWFNQPAYAIGAARCLGPAGPCADSSDRPLLASNVQGSGPGEASVYTDGTDSWLLYTPVLATEGNGPRPVMITRIGLSPFGAYVASGGPPPPLDPFTGPSL